MAAAVAREAAHGEDENRALRGLVEELKAGTGIDIPQVVDRMTGGPAKDNA